MGTMHIGRVTVARTLRARTIGLMGRARPTPMLFPKCRSIHTFFMRFTVDILYLDRSDRIIKSMPGVGPWRIVSGGRKAVSVLELPAGFIRQKGLGVGNRVEYAETPRL